MNKSAKSDIIPMNIEVDNFQLFKKHMLEKGYKQLSDRFLSKKFEEKDTGEIYQVDITIDNEEIMSLTGYTDDNEVTEIPSNIEKIVRDDIDQSLYEL